MNLVFRIVFGIVVTLIFISITFSTFFITKQYSSIPTLSIDSSENLISTGALYYTRLSKYESLYSSNELEEEILGESTNIPLFQEGKYLSSFRNIGSLHDFTGSGYIISQKGIGELYIDTISKQGKVFVYAKNTPAEITLTSDDGQIDYTTIYLAPGMYIEFRTGIGKNLNNADRLRIATVNKLGYINSLSDLEDNSYISAYFSKEDTIFYDAGDHIEKIDRKKLNFLTTLLGGDIPEISGYSYIERYLHLFVNNEKKKVFYKNLVLEGYISLLQTRKIDESLLVQVKKDESKLESLDSESYKELLSLRGDIISAVNSMQEHEYISSKILFAQLEKPGIDASLWMYPLYSFSLFSGDISENMGSQQVTKSFFDSFALYIENYDNSQDYYDYFLYFLEQRLLYLLSGNIDEQSLGSTLEVLSSYTTLSFEAKYTETNQKITQIYSLTQILESIDIFLRMTYFLDERDSNNLLVLRSNSSLGGNRLSQLDSYIEGLHSIYKANSSLLNTSSARDVKIIDNLTTTKKNIDEYVLAIGNYGQYKDIYDISKSTILNVDVINNGQFVISEATGKKYLEQFIGISQESFSLVVIDQQYYKVDNLIIGGRRFDFEIYPYESSKLKNIYIDGEIQTTQYTLDNIQDDWEEKAKTATIEDKLLYDFSRFFILTFLSQDQREVENFEIEYKQEESKAEIVFKRDILLGDRGEFAGLKDFLSIDYEDISLVQDGNSYDIYLNNVDYNFSSIDIENKNKVNGKLKSEYVLDSTNHTFKNVGFTLESDKKGSNNATLYEFGGVYISLIGNIYIDLIGDYITAALLNTQIYLDIYNTITTGRQIRNLAIEYTPTNKKTRFKFDSGEKSFTIILENSVITGMYEGTSKIASTPINMQDINSYLK